MKNKYTLRKIGTLTTAQDAIANEIKRFGGFRQFSATAAQKALDALTARGTYTIDGDTYNGYLVRHNPTGRTVVQFFAPRELTILAVDLYRSETI